MCDTGIKIILTKNKLIEVMDDGSNDAMLKGAWDKSDGIWNVNLEEGDKAVDADHNAIKYINVKPININYDTIKRRTLKNCNKPAHNPINNNYDTTKLRALKIMTIQTLIM